MRIFTVGIGTAEGELLRMKDAKGRTDYVRDAAGNVVKSHLNEALLRQVAEATEGGFYLPLRGAKTIDTLYEKGLAPLPKTEQAMKLVKRYHERYHWPLAAAIVLLLVEMLLPERRAVSRRSGKTKRAEAVLGAPAVATALALILLPTIVSASPSSALRVYQSGKYNDALKEYQLALQKKSDDPRLHFNAGAAAYRATNYDAAIQHFTSVLAARDVKLQQAAYFNLGNTHYRLGGKAGDLDGLQELWEKAIKDYQNAVTLDKNDPDAAFNLAFVKNNVEQIKRLREAARRAKDAADEATRRREYHQALEIMENLLQQNPVAKQFEDYAKKLKDIDAITNPSQP
jgi:Ca-activated chloride channel family protein